MNYIAIQSGTDTCLRKDKLIDQNDFERLTDQDFRKIFQTPDYAGKIFTAETLAVNVEENFESLSTNFVDIGTVYPEHIGNNLYRYHTGPVKVVKALAPGVQNSAMPHEFKPGELIIIRKDSDYLDCIHLGNKNFAGYLCDESGNILDPNPIYPEDVEIMGG